MLQKLWENLLAPLLQRPSHFQVAALCYRAVQTDPGIEVLVITSRDTGRWILPKGWPKRGVDASGTALEEAWEEAGVKTTPTPPRALGSYRYEKRLSGGLPVRTDVQVYAFEVMRLLEDYPEAGQRRRDWVTPKRASELVDEPELKHLLLTLPRDLGTGPLTSAPGAAPAPAPDPAPEPGPGPDPDQASASAAGKTP